MRALGLMGLKGGTLLARQFVVEIEQQIVLKVFTLHGSFSWQHLYTSSLSSTRNFWVARNRQFLAVSSLVPIRSPMARSFKPW